ncbi:B-type cyclin CLB6 NDAI_0G01100 [Naumovozyma dairenensis CBS 421]|uniref:Cyclin N-terminal domain-containing protein n=1 Tax=Naumovozyma dairenensis (strain ATCC 10597 / BCRC 20456 / CBS 421 / NBRC 0211 / NRRL Y-12639) TaxID=1071378 RepID=G0WDM5_NAUDC|nr:hypothetical protein NDAI_0G01100 [Naumovozyma dairenensis CBS 421]CCD25886.2 hypothetical protein NDAI_0G01100 [Naumovozyma dairenensis CBS 421]
MSQYIPAISNTTNNDENNNTLSIGGPEHATTKRTVLGEVPINPKKGNIKPSIDLQNSKIRSIINITRKRRLPNENEGDRDPLTKKLKIYKDTESIGDETNDETLIGDIEENDKENKKPNKPINWKDLDTLEQDDISMVTEYSNDIFQYLYEKEISMVPTHNYLLDSNSKYHIRPSMRAILIDWLVEVHEKFHYANETLFLGINIMDRFLSFNKVTVTKLQLLAVTSMFIAAKFEEVKLPKLSNYSYITDGAASNNDIKNAELYILKNLNFNIAWPNPMNFLRRISKVDKYDFQTRFIGKFLLEYLMCSHKFISLKSSMLSAIAMYVARMITSPKLKWDNTCIHYSGDIDAENCQAFEENCQELIEEIVNPTITIDSLITKYKKPKFNAIYFKVHDWCSNYLNNENDNSFKKTL